MGEGEEKGLLLFGFCWDGIAEKRRLTDFLVGVGKPQLRYEW
jgi:hypothetical protein